MARLLGLTFLVIFLRLNRAQDSSRLELEGKCFDFRCSELPSVNCAQQVGSTFIYSPSVCKSDQICNLDDDNDGTCSLSFLDLDAAKLEQSYPGTICSLINKDPSNFSQCPYGPGICVTDPSDSSRGICRGYSPGQECFSQQECDVGLYCGNSRCKYTKQIGERCEFDEECGHLGFCWFGGKWSSQGPRSIYGECRKYLGLKVGEQAFWKTGNNIKSHDSAHRMCETFYADKDGKCALGFSSTKAGMDCKQDSDCPDSLQKPFKCVCSALGPSKKYCETGPEDEL